jgi:hypothetical protein
MLEHALLVRNAIRDSEGSEPLLSRRDPTWSRDDDVVPNYHSLREEN